MVVSGCGGVEENEICRDHHFHPGNLTAERYVEVVQNHILPFAHEIGPDFLLMQDGARVHTSRVTTRFLEDAGTQVMDWPPRSPDLIFIEQLWDLIGRRLHNRQHQPQTFRNWKLHCWKNGGSFLKKPSAGLLEACHGGVKLSSVPGVVTHVIERSFFFCLAMRLLSCFCLCCKSETIKNGNLVILFCFLFFMFKMCPFHLCARCIRNKCTEKCSSLNM